ncbi:hypothetical protein VCR1J2_200509 [Vibrio coralliirubri]|nr:hypothetical protein VCR1J2_200509 [Vibrio coralliirubri]
MMRNEPCSIVKILLTVHRQSFHLKLIYVDGCIVLNIAKAIVMMAFFVLY